jgi:hypothetical protein
MKRWFGLWLIVLAGAGVANAEDAEALQERSAAAASWFRPACMSARPRPIPCSGR